MKIKKPFSFYHALKGVVCLGLLDAQDANSMLKHGVFVMHLGIRSVFGNNGRMPSKYTCEGGNVNPPLEIIGVPKSAKSLVLIMDDPDVPMGNWDHWIVFNIKPSVIRIEENSIPTGGIQAKNSWGRNNYGGPCPPMGVHRYFFKLYALNITLNLDSSAKKGDIEKAMQGFILDKAELVGGYSKE